MKNKKRRPKSSAAGVLAKKKQAEKFILPLTGLLLICFGILYFAYSSLNRQGFGVIDESVLLSIPIDELPENTLYITKDRKDYQRGKMTLIIPSIDVYAPIGESTLPEGLKEMPGLYEFSQLPGEGNVNVSIAGHRDIHGKEFYSLDEVGNGDYCYLLYEGIVYRYLYVDTKIVSPEAWDVIKPQGSSFLTLTTCDPIGTTLNRMVMRAQLADYRAFDEGYLFIPKKDTEG